MKRQNPLRSPLKKPFCRQRPKLTLARSAGFCFGVKRAIGIALCITEQKRPAFMLGDIVHNETVIKKMAAAGIKQVKRLSDGTGKTLLIRAHGEPAYVIDKAKRSGYSIVDATCPMVKEIHRIARDMDKKGYKIIVIGDKKHDEVRAIIGQIKSPAAVISNLREAVNFKKMAVKKAALVCQSTQNQEKVEKITGVLKNKIREVKFFNTICRPTRVKQNEIRTLPLSNDMVIIIGSKTSANTRRLYEISRSVNKRTYWVGNARELKPVWFNGKLNSVGVTSGSSTPDEVTRAVLARIRRLTASRTS